MCKNVSFDENKLFKVYDASGNDVTYEKDWYLDIYGNLFYLNDEKDCPLACITDDCYLYEGYTYEIVDGNHYEILQANENEKIIKVGIEESFTDDSIYPFYHKFLFAVPNDLSLEQINKLLLHARWAVEEFVCCQDNNDLTDKDREFFEEKKSFFIKYGYSCTSIIFFVTEFYRWRCKRNNFHLSTTEVVLHI